MSLRPPALADWLWDAIRAHKARTRKKHCIMQCFVGCNNLDAFWPKLQPVIALIAAHNAYNSPQVDRFPTTHVQRGSHVYWSPLEQVVHPLFTFKQSIVVRPYHYFVDVDLFLGRVNTKYKSLSTPVIVVSLNPRSTMSRTKTIAVKKEEQVIHL